MANPVAERFLAARYLLGYLDPRRSVLVARGGNRPGNKGQSPEIKVVLTADVEYTPPWTHGDWTRENGKSSVETGLHNLLDCLKSFGVTGTFLVEGIVARDNPNLISEIVARNHEVGYHGWAHESYGGWWRTNTIKQPEILNIEQVRERVRAGKDVIKAIAGYYPTSFVAPFHHVRISTLRILAQEGFTADASIYNHVYGVTEPFILEFSSKRLVEVPFAVPVRPTWRLFSPFFPTLLDSVARDGQNFAYGLDRLVTSTPIQTRCVYLLMTCHPWEFVDLHDERFLALNRLIQYLASRRASEFLTLKDVAESLAQGPSLRITKDNRES